jgi:hypothetical protein
MFLKLLFFCYFVLFYIILYSMTVTQTVKIPAGRRLIIDIPPEIPEGFAVLTFTSAGVKFPLSLDKVPKDDAPYLQLLGCHKNISGGLHRTFVDLCHVCGTGDVRGTGDRTAINRPNGIVWERVLSYDPARATGGGRPYRSGFECQPRLSRQN